MRKIIPLLAIIFCLIGCKKTPVQELKSYLNDSYKKIEKIKDPDRCSIEVAGAFLDLENQSFAKELDTISGEEQSEALAEMIKFISNVSNHMKNIGVPQEEIDEFIDSFSEEFS
ncbi:hypothetical protein [Falsiporphyromonas endometrii]|uniref:Lipoprotein n=1 Tax=Falsiporphyromonas endometrii TaxID=1387297 RepID=A0ABV9K972_9PORP